MPEGQYYMHSSPLLEVYHGGYSTAPTQDVLPREIVTAGSLQELIRKYEDYVSRCDATGKPYVAGIGKHPRCRARTISGFNKASDRGGPLDWRKGNIAALPADKRPGIAA